MAGFTDAQAFVHALTKARVESVFPSALAPKLTTLYVIGVASTMEMNTERSARTRELLGYAILVNLDEKLMRLFVTLCVCVCVKERKSGLGSLDFRI